MTYRILALIVDYNTTKDTTRLTLSLSDCLNIQKNSGIKIDIVHIDNGSNTPACLTSEQLKARIHLLRTGKNLGYAGALNFAIRHFEHSNQQQNLPAYDAYWLLNSDLEIENDSLHKLVQTLQKNSKIGAIGPLIYTDRSQEKVWGARGVISPWLGITAMTTSWIKNKPLPRWSYIPGCSLLVKRTAYEAVNGLPEHYKLYFEETEFCVKLQKKGWQLWIEPSAIVYHPSQSKRAGIPARYFAYYFIRNNLAFWRNNFQIPILFQIPRTFFVMIKEVFLPLRKARTLRVILDRSLCALAGFWDGIFFALGKPTFFEKKLFPTQANNF